MALRGLYTALDAAGVERGSVEVVELDIDEKWLADLDQSDTASLWATPRRYASQHAEIMALANGECDAIFSSAFRAVEIAYEMDARVLMDLSLANVSGHQLDNTNPTALTASGELCDREPEVVGKYLATLIRTAQWAKQHRDEVVACVAREVVAAEQVVDAGYTADFHTTLVPELSDDLVLGLGSQVKFLLENSFVENDVEMSSFIDRRPLQIARAVLEEELTTQDWKQSK
jgi:2'-hydroxybiphenyl-2-sulfinate desulfinase